MATFKVDIFHNVTTTGEAAAKGDEDCARLVAAHAGYADGPAIFSRLRGSKARPGDRLRKVVTLTLDAKDSRAAADAAFEAGNAPFDTPAIRAYRAARVRSLSTGDVVVVHTPWGADNYVCESSDWSTATLADFEIEGWAMATIRLTDAQAAAVAATKALGLPTEVFRFTEHNGDQHEIECRHEGMAIALCDSHPAIAYVTDLDGNLIGGSAAAYYEED